MLELASPDPQRLLALPLKVIVVRHQVDVRHRDVVLLGDLAGGKPGEAADGQLWLGREGWVNKGGLSLWGALGQVCSLGEVQDGPYNPFSPSCTQVGRRGAGRQCLQLEGGQTLGKARWS